MRDFEETQRILFRSHLQTNIAHFSSTHSDVMTILATRSLVSRLDSQQIANSVALVRERAWAAVSVSLHAQLGQLATELAGYLSTRLSTPVLDDLRDLVDTPTLGMTLPEWLASAEIMEKQRVLKAMRGGYALSLNALESFERARPFGVSHSTVSAITVTTATNLINRGTLAMLAKAGRREYRLVTRGDVRDPEVYRRKYPITEQVSPAFIGDRGVPSLEIV